MAEITIIISNGFGQTSARDIFSWMAANIAHTMLWLASLIKINIQTVKEQIKAYNTNKKGSRHKVFKNETVQSNKQIGKNFVRFNWVWLAIKAHIHTNHTHTTHDTIAYMEQNWRLWFVHSRILLISHFVQASYVSARWCFFFHVPFTCNHTIFVNENNNLTDKWNEYKVRYSSVASFRFDHCSYVSVGPKANKWNGY